MGQLVQYWRGARTQKVETAVAVQVGDFEPSGIGKERGRETEGARCPPHLPHTGDFHAGMPSGCVMRWDPRGTFFPRDEEAQWGVLCAPGWTVQSLATVRTRPAIGNLKRLQEVMASKLPWMGGIQP